MDMSQFLTALRARRRAFFLVLGATVLAAIAIALIMPKNFVGTTTVLVDARDEQSMGAAGVRPASPRAMLGYMQTQLDLIGSGRVAKRVVRDLKIAQMPGVREDFEAATGGQGNIEDWLADQLLLNLKADNSASNVITISFGAKDPRVAADIANAFARAYIDTSLELRTEPSREAAAWFEEQLKGLRTSVNQAQAKLTAYQKEKGIFGIDERSDLETARLTALSTQLLQARNDTYDAQTRYKHAAEFLGSASAGASAAAADALPEVMGNASVQAVKGDLMRAEARLEQASTDLGPNHPAYLRAASEVSGLRGKLAQEMKKVVAGLSNHALQARKREQELAAAYQAQQNELLKKRDARVELAVLTRDLDMAQRAYDTALNRWLTNKVDSRAEMTNVSVLTPAIAPLEPKSPKVGLIAGLSVVLGGLLAGGVVFLLETLDRRVRSRSDLESRLAVPTLGRLSRWQPTGGRLLPSPHLSGARAARALPHPW
jgi:polysaccharide biosynthesis transport protein